MLKELKDDGYKLVLISNKYDGATKDLAKRFFGTMFDGAYGSRDDIAAKPDREIFEFVCKDMGFAQSGIVYVGDIRILRQKL